MNKSATEMFEELGWEQVKNNIEEISYQREIYTNKYSDTISRYSHIDFDLYTRMVYASNYLTLEEIHAINKQIEELGWLDVKDKR